MKKIFFIAIAISGLAIISSCKKTWTCSCAVTGASGTYNYSIKGLQKSDATTDCNNMASTAQVSAGTSGPTTCTVN